MQLTAFFIIFVLVMTSGGQMRKLKFSKNSFNSIVIFKGGGCSCCYCLSKATFLSFISIFVVSPPSSGTCDNERLGYDSPSHFSRFSAFCNWRPVCFSPAKLTAQADAEQWPAHFSHILDASTPLFNHFPSIYSVWRQFFPNLIEILKCK